MLLTIADELDPQHNKGDAYSQFQERYWADLEGFVRDCVKWEEGQSVTKYQGDGMQRLVKKKRFSMRGPHGLGKTAFAALTVLWFALTRDGRDWKVPTLASAWRQLRKFLWPEIHKWARNLRWDVIGRDPFVKDRELLKLSIKLETGEAFAISSNVAAAIEGAHADHLMYVFDESKIIPNDVWDAAEGAMSIGETFWLAISTPGEPMGRFYDIHSRKPGYDDWDVLHVTLEMAIGAGRISPDWAATRKRQWGETSSVYINRVLGDFASDDEDGVIPLSAVERAIERWHKLNDSKKWGDFYGVGVDIGRGGDPSVMAFRYDNAIRELQRFHEKTIMPVTGRVATVMKRGADVKAVIDVTGIGAGVVDRLREMPELASRVVAFIAAARTTKTDESQEIGFVDMRSASYWSMRELLLKDIPALPPDDRLIGDLTAPRYTYVSGGKIRVEGKDSIKKRLGRSTDDGDAVTMIFVEEFEPLIMIGF